MTDNEIYIYCVHWKRIEGIKQTR